MVDASGDREWVWHNGARIRRTFFEENVAEAREYDWACGRWSEDDDHAHCIVCGYAIGTENELYYKFRFASLCEYCFDTVVGVSPGSRDNMP